LSVSLSLGSALTLVVGWQEGPVKIAWWGAGMGICLRRGADLHMAHMAQLMALPLPPTVSCFSKIQIGFTSLVPASAGSPGQRTVKQVSLVLLSVSWQNFAKNSGWIFKNEI